MRPIIECNLSCSCSIRICTNRVVDRGMKYPLKIIRRPRIDFSGSSQISSRCSLQTTAHTIQAQSNSINTNTTTTISSQYLHRGKKMNNQQHQQQQVVNDQEMAWSVRTVVDIPAGGFVCELVGQYVMGSSKVVHVSRQGR